MVYKSILRTRNSCQKLFPTFTCDVDFGFARLGFCSGMKIFRKIEVCVLNGIKLKDIWEHIHAENVVLVLNNNILYLRTKINLDVFYFDCKIGLSIGNRTNFFVLEIYKVVY